MKRILPIISIVLLCAFEAAAYDVEESRARSVAQRFFERNGLTADFKNVSASESKASGDEPMFYIYNSENEGFVVISADDFTRPILAYSLDHKFNTADIPAEVRWWLNETEKAIRTLKEQGRVEVGPEILSAWEDCTGGLTKAGGTKIELNTVQWHQDSPFNDKCPIVDGERCVSGCVPTALAELMCYYGWPEKGSGTIESYTDGNDNVLKGYELGTVYNWAELQKLTDEEEADAASDEVKENAAQLLKDVGYAMQCSYSPSGTGAYESDIMEYFCGKFAYNKGAELIYRQHYTPEDWIGIVRSQLETSHPVYYTGDDSDGGHAFLIDGIDENDLVHFNFGWGSGYNGFFWIGSEFYGGQAAIINLYPDEEGTSEYAPAKISVYNYTLSGSISAGKSFKITFNCLNHGATFSGYVRPVLIDQSGSIKKVLSKARSATITYMNGISPTFECTVDTLTLGDGIALARSADNENWELTEISRDGSNLSVCPVMGCDFIDAEQSYNVGDALFLRLKNNSNHYVWDDWLGGNPNIVWTLWVNGEKYEELSDYSTRYFILDTPGEWMVSVTYTEAGNTDVKKSLAACFTVN